MSDSTTPTATPTKEYTVAGSSTLDRPGGMAVYAVLAPDNDAGEPHDIFAALVLAEEQPSIPTPVWDHWERAKYRVTIQRIDSPERG